MAIVTGDRYLDLLSRFIEQQAGALLDGGLVLKLNPVGLHYVQTRLEALQELEQLRSGAPVDYLRAYVADLGDHRALEQLRRVLRLLGSLQVVAVLAPPARDPTPITLRPFSRLRSLELRGCDLSTSAARGLLELRPILEKLICHNSAVKLLPESILILLPCLAPFLGVCFLLSRSLFRTHHLLENLVLRRINLTVRPVYLSLWAGVANRSAHKETTVKLL